MGTILTSDTSDIGWHHVPRDGSEVPKGLTGKQLCQSAWTAAFEAFGENGEREDAPLLIMAIGPQPDALEGLDVPKNARCYPYVPQVQAGCCQGSNQAVLKLVGRQRSTCQVQSFHLVKPFCVYTNPSASHWTLGDVGCFSRAGCFKSQKYNTPHTNKERHKHKPPGPQGRC